MPNFNSAEYSWKDLEVAILGRSLVNITEVEYTTDVEKKHIYGRGSKPIGIQSGNEKPTGQITIGQSELEAIIQKAKESNKRPTDLSFDINITYTQDGTIVRDRVKGAQLSQVPKSIKQGDPSMTVKLPFLALDIEYDI
jgi:hypothetical protein